MAEKRKCNSWYRIHTAQRSCGHGFYCHTHLPGAWDRAVSSDLFLAAIGRSAVLRCVNQEAAQQRHHDEPVVVAWHLNNAEGVRWARFYQHLKLVRRINETILSPGLRKRSVRHILIPATEQCRERLNQETWPGMEIAASRDEAEQLLLMVGASVLVTFASVPGLVAAALAPRGAQLHLFLPPKEVAGRKSPLRLRDDGAFQTHFFRKNTVPLDFSGKPIEDYSGKLSEMLSAIDRAQVAPAAVAEQSFEQWLDATSEEERKSDDPACRASCGSCSSNLLGKPPVLSLDADVPTFFLHESGGLNFSAVVARFEELMGGLPPDTAFPMLGVEAYKQLRTDVWKPSVRDSGIERATRLRGEAAKDCGWGQYLVDVPLLAALNGHPQRVHVAEQAEVHILGALPYASHLLSIAVEADSELHRARMEAAQTALDQLPHFGCNPPTERCNAEKPMLLLVPGESLSVVGKSFQHALLKRQRPILAVNDGMMSWLGPNANSKHNPAVALMEEGIVLPYRSHVYAYEEGDNDRLGARRGLMFHGGAQRFDYGVRGRMLTSMKLAHEYGNSSRRAIHKTTAAHEHVEVPLLLRTSSNRVTSGAMVGVAGAMDGNTTAAAVLKAYKKSGAAYRSASMCMCPSGDIVSSRRMFDAMSAGCVPVLVRSKYVLNQDSKFSSVPRDRSFYLSLPFPRSIAWQNLTLRWAPDMFRRSLDRSPKALSCAYADAKWMREWHHRLLTSASFESSLRARVRAAFRQHLDYERNPRGVATAMLREAAARSAWGRRPPGSGSRGTGRRAST